LFKGSKVQGSGPFRLKFELLQLCLQGLITFLVIEGETRNVSLLALGQVAAGYRELASITEHE
jgi:hypothetical protein